jgi:SPP1 family predicted phage head-tail adaptor
MLGGLRNRVTIQTLTTLPTGGGTFAETWTTSSTVWASVNSKASETYSQEKEQQDNKYSIKMRKRTLTNANRLIYNGQILHIESVTDETERGKMITVIGRVELDN